jgi:hypothetical protein
MLSLYRMKWITLLLGLLLISLAVDDTAAKVSATFSFSYTQKTPILE